MILDFLQKLYTFVSKLSSDTKNFVIIIMFFIISILAYEDLGDKIAKQTVQTSVETKLRAEEYSMEMTPKINSIARQIVLSDGDVCNVILMSYHNTQTSSQGFSYRYITGLTEEGTWEHTKSYFSNWRELSAINFGDELAKIHRLKYLRVDSVDAMKTEYPKLYYQVKDSEAQSAAFYPIERRDSPVGMIVILYKGVKQYDLGYYIKTIKPHVEELADILDYMDYLNKQK